MKIQGTFHCLKYSGMTVILMGFVTQSHVLLEKTRVELSGFMRNLSISQPSLTIQENWNVQLYIIHQIASIFETSRMLQ